MRGRAFYSQWVRPGSLVFDVGANVGHRSEMFLALGARVVAIEPQPACIAALRALEQDRLVVEQVALGADVGTGEIRIADVNTISSMADGWIERVRRSGRFAQHQWGNGIPVRVATLDSLIERHGRPDFCKIDVEGYELEVVTGLSQPLPVLSFEFAVEYRDHAERVLARLEGLGFDRFNYAPEETFSLVWDTWRDVATIRSHLAAFSKSEYAWGDVYAAAGALGNPGALHARPGAG